MRHFRQKLWPCRDTMLNCRRLWVPWGSNVRIRLKKNWDDHLEYAGHEKEKRNAVALICFTVRKMIMLQCQTKRWPPCVGIPQVMNIATRPVSLLFSACHSDHSKPWTPAPTMRWSFLNLACCQRCRLQELKIFEDLGSSKMVCLLENLENHSPYRNNSNNNNIGNIIWASSFSRSVLGFWNHPNVTICGKRVKFLEAWPMAKHSPTPPEMWSGTPNHRIHTCVYIYYIYNHVYL